MSTVSTSYICQNIKDKVFDLMKILFDINEELIARKDCSVTDEKGARTTYLVTIIMKIQTPGPP